MKFENILFDLDGTIIKSDRGVTIGIERSLKAIGVDVGDKSTLLKFLGPPMYESYTKYYNITDEEYSKALDVFHDYYRSKGIFECEIYAGIEKTFARLKEAGAKLYVATSKPEREARRIIEHFNLEKYFDFIGGSDGDHGTDRCTKTAVMEYVLDKVNIQDKSKVLMVGDRFHDIEGAKNLGVSCLSVLYGYGNLKEFEKYKTDYIVESTEDIADFIIKGLSNIK